MCVYVCLYIHIAPSWNVSGRFLEPPGSFTQRVQESSWRVQEALRRVPGGRAPQLQALAHAFLTWSSSSGYGIAVHWRVWAVAAETMAPRQATSFNTVDDDALYK